MLIIAQAQGVRKLFTQRRKDAKVFLFCGFLCALAALRETIFFLDLVTTKAVGCFRLASFRRGDIP